jgi:N-acetyl sugar amidotransferase
MRYCTKCLYPANHPLNITFDKEGVCSGCRVHEEKFTLDWAARQRKLESLLQIYRSKSGHRYDCIIPVSGARDSYFIVHVVKKVFGLNPLLVTYNKHYNTRRGTRNFAYLKTIFDCDALTQTCDPAKIKRITRWTLEKMGSMYWHCLAGQTVFPVQTAVRLKIPLIVWGVHQGIDQVGMFLHTDEVEMTRKYRKEHDLMGFEAEDLVGGESGLTEIDLAPFFYPDSKEIEKTGVRGIYLSNYIAWDSKKQHELMIAKYGYETAEQQRTFDTYNDVDCIHYSGLHDYIKYIKFGYGKVTDHASREIRWGRLTRTEGIELVKKYEKRLPNDIRQFTDWMQIKGSDMFRNIDRFRDLKAWQRIHNGEWRLNDPITRSIRAAVPDPATAELALQKLGKCHFIVTPSRQPAAVETEYVLMARGFVDGHPISPEHAAYPPWKQRLAEPPATMAGTTSEPDSVGE